MKEKHRQYDKEFIKNAITLALRGDKSTTQVAKSLGIPPTTLFQWLRKYAPNQKPGDLNAKESVDYVMENAHLKKRVAELEEEAAILKNAMGIFSRAQK